MQGEEYHSCGMIFHSILIAKSDLILNNSDKREREEEEEKKKKTSRKYRWTSTVSLLLNTALTHKLPACTGVHARVSSYCANVIQVRPHKTDGILFWSFVFNWGVGYKVAYTSNEACLVNMKMHFCRIYSRMCFYCLDWARTHKCRKCMCKVLLSNNTLLNIMLLYEANYS